MRNASASLVPSIVMAVLGAAGLWKLIDLPSFVQSLEFWTLVPRSLRIPVGIAVPSLEVTIAGLWFAWSTDERLRWAAVVLIAVLSVAFALHWVAGRPPACHCLGTLLAFDESVGHAKLVLARNCVLLVGLSTGRGRRNFGSIEGRVRGRRRKAPRGFTLLETLTVIVVLAMLVTAFLPSLGQVRRRAVETRVLSDLRSHATNIALYSASWRERYPFFTYPDVTYSVLRHENTTVNARYFEAAYYWNFAMADEFYDGKLAHPSFYPRRHVAGSIAMPLWYSHCFIASPEFWNPTTRSGVSQWRSVSASEVVFPQKKVLMIDSLAIPESDQYLLFSRQGAYRSDLPTALTDGSARVAKGHALLPGYPSTVGIPPNAGLFSLLPGMATLDGVRGRDFK
jgi:prepilin-type N-terminal cleavage/methylation domain-containing protein